MKEQTTRVTLFNKTKLVPIVTYTNSKKDEPPKNKWDAVLWVERGEDWYGLDCYRRNRKTVLVVERETWLRCKELEKEERKKQ